MKPILLIHGYSSERSGKPVNEIYNGFPDELRSIFGSDNVKELDLSRWISLNDGICLDDVSYAMDRAMKADYPHLLGSGFHVISHSTGALIVRNWIKKFSPKPSPIINLVHLAGANFGSGLAHIGKGQLSRWGRYLADGTGCGYRILDELEFGSWKTLDLHLHFLKSGSQMHKNYEVQEFCIVGSQIPKMLRMVPIRYVREDSSDSTVRTAGCNLNFNYISIKPTPSAYELSCEKLESLIELRQEGRPIPWNYYEIDEQILTGNTGGLEVPFSIPYEIAHSGSDIGIVTGNSHREPLLHLVEMALKTDPKHPGAYLDTAKEFKLAQKKVFNTVAKRKSLIDWNIHEQYEGHAQLIFRIRDQEGLPVEHFDIYMKSEGAPHRKNKLADMIENRHCNRRDKGTMTFYLRTQHFSKRRKIPWVELLDNVAPLDIEITGSEPLSSDISYVPLRTRLSSKHLRAQLKSFQTTVVDVTLLRLPSSRVFEINP